MIKNSIEQLAKSIGFDIGNSDNIVQADLLNGLSDGLSKIQQIGDYDMQICYIVEKLSKESFKMIEALNSFVKLDKDD